MKSQNSESGYELATTHNSDKPLTREQFEGLSRRVTGFHFAKELLPDDPATRELLFIAEAFCHELLRRAKAHPFPETEDETEDLTDRV